MANNYVKLANNTTTTEEGYALDGRQGKNLSDLIANKAKQATATLAVENWAGEGPFTQTVSVIGVTTNNAIVVSPAPVNFAAWGEAGIYASAQAMGELTFTAETKPTVALTANILYVN